MSLDNRLVYYKDDFEDRPFEEIFMSLQDGVLFLTDLEPNSRPFLVLFCGPTLRFISSSRLLMMGQYIFQLKDNSGFSFTFQVKSQDELGIWNQYICATQSVSPEDALTQTIKRYYEIDEIGKGSFGVVHRAVDIVLRREVAVKTISTQSGSKTLLKNTLRELRVLRHLNHPHINSILNSFTLEGEVFVVMSLKVSDLSKLVHYDHDYRKLTAFGLIRIAHQLLSAVSHCHEWNVIHRDIKPANVLLDSRGNVTLADFGLARVIPPIARIKRELRKLVESDGISKQLHAEIIATLPDPTPSGSPSTVSQSSSPPIATDPTSTAPSLPAVPSLPIASLPEDDINNQDVVTKEVLESLLTPRLVSDSNLPPSLTPPSSSPSLPSTPPLTEYIATRWYRAPEVILSQGAYSIEQDVWAAGCTIGELFARRPIFPGTSYVNQIEKIIEVMGSPRPDELTFKMLVPARKFVTRLKFTSGLGLEQVMLGSPKTIRAPLTSEDSLQLVDLVKQLLAFTPFRRITCGEALHHPIFLPIDSSHRLKQSGDDLLILPTQKTFNPGKSPVSLSDQPSHSVRRQIPGIQVSQSLPNFPVPLEPLPSPRLDLPPAEKSVDQTLKSALIAQLDFIAHRSLIPMGDLEATLTSEDKDRLMAGIEAETAAISLERHRGAVYLKKRKRTSNSAPSHSEPSQTQAQAPNPGSPSSLSSKTNEDRPSSSLPHPGLVPGRTLRDSREAVKPELKQQEPTPNPEFVSKQRRQELQKLMQQQMQQMYSQEHEQEKQRVFQELQQHYQQMRELQSQTPSLPPNGSKISPAPFLPPGSQPLSVPPALLQSEPLDEGDMEVEGRILPRLMSSMSSFLSSSLPSLSRKHTPSPPPSLPPQPSQSPEEPLSLNLSSLAQGLLGRYGKPPPPSSSSQPPAPSVSQPPSLSPRLTTISLKPLPPPSLPPLPFPDKSLQKLPQLPSHPVSTLPSISPSPSPLSKSFILSSTTHD